VGYGAEENSWLPCRELEDCVALDDWFISQGQLDKVNADILEHLNNGLKVTSTLSTSRTSDGSG
jgi:hypothetical protein